MDKIKDMQGGFIEEEKSPEQTKQVKKVKKNKKDGFFSKLGGKLKDIFSELKKVSWPSFSKVVKQTGVVLVVVLAFLIVITAFDTGLNQLLKLISPNA